MDFSTVWIDMEELPLSMPKLGFGTSFLVTDLGRFAPPYLVVFSGEISAVKRDLLLIRNSTSSKLRKTYVGGGGLDILG